MRQLTLEERATPNRGPVRQCCVPGCSAGDADICRAYEHIVCYAHLNRYGAEVPWTQKGYAADKAAFAAWLRGTE